MSVEHTNYYSTVIVVKLQRYPHLPDVLVCDKKEWEFCSAEEVIQALPPLQAMRRLQSRTRPVGGGVSRPELIPISDLFRTLKG